MTSLTGDPTTDALVPVALQLVGAVRAQDSGAVDEVFASAIELTGGRCDPAAALAIVCAALVPEDAQPSQLLRWQRAAAEYQRLIEKGVDPVIAEQLAGVEDENRNVA